MKHLKYFIWGGLILFVCIIMFVFYNLLQKEFLSKQKFQNESAITQLEVLANDNLPKFSTQRFVALVQILIKNSPLESVSLKYNDYSFTNTILFSKVNGIDESWRIVDVTTDIKTGEIQTSYYGEYTFSPHQNFDTKKPVFVKFQAFKNGFVKDFTVRFDFEVSVGENITQTATIQNRNYTILYSFMPSQTAAKVNNLFMWFLTGSITIIIGLSIFFILLYHKVIQYKLYDNIYKINRYLHNVLNKNFQTPEGLDFHHPQMQQLLNNITDLSKRFVQTVNELNVSKDIIEKKEITDELTGLPNKKWFEKDLKHMFVTNKEGYIVYLKIDKLGEFAKKHGGDIVNSLVEDFAKTVENYFTNNRDINAEFYRFVGAEFAIILYVNEVQKVKNLLQELIATTRTLDERYYFFDNLIYYGATPFDKYGTVESILQSAKDEYHLTYTNKELFHVLDITRQMEKNKELEKSVKDIIDRDDFALQYVYDTYDFNKTPVLIMQEITPMLIDMRTFDRFPIGVFISIAEKMDMALEFDKLLIQKVLSHIEMGALEHEIAVNLSVGSFTSIRFITWLNSIMTYEKNANKLVFVITAYSAAGNFEKYKRFVDTIRDFDAKVMIKRFDLNDFSLEKLELIKPDYIRIEKEYCNDIKRDPAKQHKIKQILLFAEDHDIKVLGDNVKNDVDYAMIEKLGFYGTSR